ncbi:hypothetical protein [Amycolatopsis sp. BJA-103]|uniref:hypothetical protein n=1 Tax=unclassified Amycolatopsis TaxID=2618356 RepID=UPI000C783685|nr:hypothetical protein [Amycolatopsis sp. BJA-103]AUI59141.1 hypothetical protein BKN51_13590 [Amycolatopsis sp. BJA-103]PNE17411.1 hypothetical protein B1H26_20935 [Amycolatopsis sp. BJA-103]
MYERDLPATEDALGAVNLPRALEVGSRNHALAGSKPRLSANPLATLSGDPGSPSVVSLFTGGWI